MKNQKAITLISLVITIIVLITLAIVAIYLSLENNGIFTRAKQAKEVTNKQEATDIINLKITTAQMNKYVEKQQMPTLKELSLLLKEDNEIQYVIEKNKSTSAEYNVTSENPSSIYTKLYKYPYEFEINSRLQLASIDGIKIASNEKETDTTSNSQNTMFYEEHFTGEYWLDKRKIYEVTKKFTTANTEGTHETDIIIQGIDNVIIDETKSYVLENNEERLTNNINIYWRPGSYFFCWWEKDKLNYSMKSYLETEALVTLRYTKISEKQNIE
ncbi:MAG: hypothetical protein HFJ41_03310 [Clostridia bacterium]|nr:hypothetical protein [Clostridia bacterium]